MDELFKKYAEQLELFKRDYIKSIQVVSEAGRAPSLTVEFSDGTTKIINKENIDKELNIIKTEFSKKFEVVEQTISEFSLDQIKLLQHKLKAIEDTLKSKDKRVKTITISEEAHDNIKKYCVSKGVKINDWVESTLLLHTSESKSE